MASSHSIEDQVSGGDDDDFPHKSDDGHKQESTAVKETNEDTNEDKCSDKDEEELEEGELKDDDDDDDDDDDIQLNNATNSRLSNSDNYNCNNNNNIIHSSALSKESSYSNDQKLQLDQNNSQNNSNFHHRGEHVSPNNPPHHPGMQGPFHSHQQFGANSNNNHYRYPPTQDGGNLPPGMPPNTHSNHPMVGPNVMYPRAGSKGVQKVNVRCRFYSKTSNKCTWGDHCRFEHRDDSPGPGDIFDDRIPGPPGMMGPVMGRGPPQPLPPVGIADRPYPPYAGRHQPYYPPHGYGYGSYDQPPYGPHHSASPPLPPHVVPPHHWRHQQPHSPYQAPSFHPPESISPAQLPSSGSSIPPNPSGGSRGASSQPSSVGVASSAPVTAGSGGQASPGYPSPSSSSMYERKHRLAYELAPWNDKGYPANRYDRGDVPGGYPPLSSRGGMYRNHYSRDPYGREPMPPHMSGAPHPYSSGYPANYPPAYRGGPPGPHAPHYRYSSSSQRVVPPDSRRSRSNKRGHDEDESSWSDSGSEDSILGQASSSGKKANKKRHHQRIAHDSPELTTPKESLDQGSGTPPAEPLNEDRERQEMLLNKLKEIEDLMAKKKGEQDDAI